MHMLARVCFFRIGSRLPIVSVSGAMDYNVAEDGVAWQGHWDIAPF